MPTWLECWALPLLPGGPTPSWGRYRRIARWRGTKQAIVAVGRWVLIIVWQLLADPDARLPRSWPRLL
jgi:hypothetical protein